MDSYKNIQIDLDTMQAKTKLTLSETKLMFKTLTKEGIQ